MEFSSYLVYLQGKKKKINNQVNEVTRKHLFTLEGNVATFYGYHISAFPCSCLYFSIPFSCLFYCWMFVIIYVICNVIWISNSILFSVFQAVLHDHERSRISSLTKDDSEPRALAYIYQNDNTYSLFYIKMANLVTIQNRNMEQQNKSNSKWHLHSWNGCWLFINISHVYINES